MTSQNTDDFVPNNDPPIARVLQPIQDFIHQSSSGGIVLMVATLLALVLANSPLVEAYEALLHTYLSVSLGDYTLSLSLLHWINDGLMAIFFLLVGLEIKREILVGELSSVRAATLPIVAAVGGAVVPALIYLALNMEGPAAAGWGIPMATDIAFALGVLALLGSRVPFALKIFLTAVAIVDDLIAVLVIAFFYSSGVNFTALFVAFALLFLMTLGNIFGIRTLLFFLTLGVVVWAAFLFSGIHATIAGVLVALTIPARYNLDERTFLHRTRALLQEIEASEWGSSRMVTDDRQQSAILALEEAVEQVQAPLQKLENSLHVPVQFLIVPVFALANAGVPLGLSGVSSEELGVGLGILLGLLVGKPVGLMVASWLAVRAGIASLPPDVTRLHILGAGILAGIGFTMSIFVATLGFGESSDFTHVAKLGILVASLLAGTVGYFTLRLAASRVGAG